MNILNAIPTAAQPYFWPVLGIVAILMGFTALVSFNNPGLRAAVKDHILWIIIGAVLVFGGGTMIASFLRSAGAS